MARVHLKIAAFQDDAVLKDPFFLVETFISVDGWRTRVCAGRWPTWDAANEHKQALIAKAEEVVP